MTQQPPEAKPRKQISDTFPYAVKGYTGEVYNVNCPQTITPARVIGSAEYIERSITYLLKMDTDSPKNKRLLTRKDREIFANTRAGLLMLRHSFYAEWWNNTPDGNYTTTPMRKAVDRYKKWDEFKKRIFRFLKIN